MVPTAEGDYQLALRLDVQLASLSDGAINVHGEAAVGTGASGDQRLPVTVYTRYSVSQATVDLATNIIRLLGFPVTAIALKRYEGVEHFDAPPPDPGADSATSASGA